MSDPTTKPEDELAGTEQPFVQHLIELRDRLIKAVIAIAVFAIALSLYPGPGPLYDILAAPLVAQLPVGATMIATSVISPFLVPLKILLMAAFLLALPVVLYQMWAFVAPGWPSFTPSLKPLTAPPRSEPMFLSFLVPNTSTTINNTINQCQTENDPMGFS